jgi:hypothetical protein
MIIFTSICANYIHKARTLADSVKKNIPDAKFFVCITERKKTEQMSYNSFDRVVLAKDVWDGNFNQFIFKHTIVEASTAVKACFFQYLMKNFPDENNFIYLDPDCYVYSDFVEVRQLLKKRPIILCPHLLQTGNIGMELSSTAHGVYNLGFLAVNNSEEAARFIAWWAERLSLYCYDDIPRGIFTDQKWIDLAPCFFDTEVLKHRGYDFAPWSLLNCDMKIQNGECLISGDKLRFIHFSGYGETAKKCMDDWLPQGEHPFRELYRQYSEKHDKNDYDNVSLTTWSYSRYYSNEKIQDLIREKYRRNPKVMFAIEDPFTLSNRKIRALLKKNPITVPFHKKIYKIAKEEGIKGIVQRVNTRVFRF